MTSNSSSFNFARVADRLAARVPQVAATITDFRMVSPSLAQVVATFNTIDANRGDLTAAVGRALSNGASPIESSWRSLSSYGAPAMVGFVAVNTETRPYEEASASKMVALASNMLMDASDETLWQVQADGSGGKMLCKQSTGENLRALMETARVRAPRAPKLDTILSSVNKGDFVSYVDPVTATVRHGYVLATDMEIESVPVGGLDVDTVGVEAIEIMPLPIGPDNTSDEATGEGNRIAERLVEEDAPVLVPSTLVVEAAALNGDDVVNTEVAAPANASNKQSMKDYYKRMYANTPGYFSQLVKIIDSHAGI